jgi:hypothetical protein
MAVKTKCFYCDGLVFEIAAVEVLDAAQPYQVVQCARCAMPIGLAESPHIEALLAAQTERDATFRASVTTRLQWINQKLAEVLEAVAPQKTTTPESP